MFQSKILSPTRAELVFQFNAQENTELRAVEITAKTAPELMRKIDKNKAAWLRRTMEHVLNLAKKSLAMTATHTLTWPEKSRRIKGYVEISEQSDAWKARYLHYQRMKFMLSDWTETDADWSTMANHLSEPGTFEKLYPPRQSIYTNEMRRVCEFIIEMVQTKVYG